MRVAASGIRSVFVGVNPWLVALRSLFVDARAQRCELCSNRAQLLLGRLELLPFRSHEPAVRTDAFANAIAALVDLFGELFVQRIRQALTHAGDLSAHLRLRLLALRGEDEEDERGDH